MDDDVKVVEAAKGVEGLSHSWKDRRGAGDGILSKVSHTTALTCAHSLCPCRNTSRLNHSLQHISEEVTRQSSYRTFFLWGGPSAMAGGLDVSWYASFFFSVLAPTLMT